MFKGSVVVLAVRIVVGLEEVVRFPRLLTDWRQTRKKSAPSGGGLADSLSSLSGPEAGGSTRSIARAEDQCCDSKEVLEKKPPARAVDFPKSGDSKTPTGGNRFTFVKNVSTHRGQRVRVATLKLFVESGRPTARTV